jgi:23S rRNA pseudouridine1911/1915/1917 synthase
MKKLKIEYEDKTILIVDKPYKKLTIASGNSDNSLYREVREYLNKKNEKCFIVHRLDYETSGLVLFAKTEKVKLSMQEKWDEVERLYYAVVHGKLQDGVLENYLSETKTLLTYVSNKNVGKYAKLDYKVLSTKNDKSLVSIKLYTGRKNQIRVQFANINHPIVGDKKYGIKDGASRMYLHAFKLKFIHPIDKKEICIEEDIPVDFKKICGINN